MANLPRLRLHRPASPYMKNFEHVYLPTIDELARAVASAWLDELTAAYRRGEAQYVALSGGRSAKAFFSAVAAQASRGEARLSRVHFFWADERCVPPEDRESNFRLAQELLFAPMKIGKDYVHRVRGEETPDVGASEAEREIRRVASLNSEGQPVLDLVFLGMGEDGHVASLFPTEPNSAKTEKAVYRGIKDSPKPPPNRVTLSYAAIAAAKQVWVLVSGAGKAAALRESLDPTGQTPLARVIQSRSQTRIISDIPLN